MKQYTPEEIKELIQWFRSNLEKLPQSLKYRPGVYAPDLRRTVESSIHQLESHPGNQTYEVNALHLEEIKQVIEEIWANENNS